MDIRVIALILSFSYACIIAVNVPPMPSFLKICRRHDRRLNDCVKHSVEALRPYLKTGIPELFIPPCEPLNVPQCNISQAAGPILIRSTYSNIQVFGSTDFTLKSVNIDVKKDITKLKLFVPHLSMRADYNMQGKLFMLPIVGQGQAIGNYSDIDAIVTIKARRYISPKTKKLHYNVTDFHVDFDLGHARIHLDNLFNGDENLGRAMNVFLNDNWKTVAAEIKPAVDETLSKLFKSFVNDIYTKYPLDVLLPL